jgi:arsenical pump membrane protein
MAAITMTEGATWAIAALATGGVIARPWRWPEAVWAVLGATSLVALSLVPWRDALGAVEKGTDVYLFLAGMMLLAELARQHGIFDWLAALAARHARGSADRLFALVFGVGIIVTVFLSNDATAVVLTPAVYAVTKAAKAKPLPYLFACAFIANAASFALPISNPANLVVFGGHMPPLSSWLARFCIPSILSMGATFIALRLAQRASLRQSIADHVDAPLLSRAGRLTAWGIAAAVVTLLTASGFGVRLGVPTMLAGAATAGIVLATERRALWELLRHISWSVLPLVAGLFVLVEGLVRTGVVQDLTRALQVLALSSPAAASWASGIVAALACNLMNNLPVGLIAGSAIAAVPVHQQVAGALLVGVDLGPNLSITGSLATILWLVALRREGHHVSALDFLRLGVIVTVPALAMALAGLILVPFK